MLVNNLRDRLMVGHRSLKARILVRVQVPQQSCDRFVAQREENTMKDYIEKFEKFISAEIESAIDELSKIKTESNRKHLQRLVYVNLVNRFDSLVDSLLLKFTLIESDFKKRVLNEIKEEPVYLKDVYDIILSKDPKASVEKRVENIVRLKFLNQRHSAKLRQLLYYGFGWKDTDIDRPRVFVNNGKVFTDVKRRTGNKIPDSIVGYADWLYSRRNSFVHHDKLEITKRDADYIKGKFNITVSGAISLKISSIKSARRYYSDLCKLLKNNLHATDRDASV